MVTFSGTSITSKLIGHMYTDTCLSLADKMAFDSTKPPHAAMSSYMVHSMG
jgi:hypothetical protein